MSEAPQPPRPDQPGPPGGPAGGSRNLWAVAGVAAGVIILAVVLFLLLRPDDDDNAADVTPSVSVSTTVQTTTEATTQVTTTVQTTTEQVTTTAPAEQPQRIVVNVVNAEPVGGVQQVDVEQGRQVMLVVNADVEDEVHLHGYDLSARVAPDHPARITFTADVAGEFEAELEERGVTIVELIVSP